MFCLHLMVWNKRDPTYFVGPYCQEKKRLLLVTCLTQPQGQHMRVANVYAFLPPRTPFFWTAYSSSGRFLIPHSSTFLHHGEKERNGEVEGELAKNLPLFLFKVREWYEMKKYRIEALKICRKIYRNPVFFSNFFHPETGMYPQAASPCSVLPAK